MLETTQGLVMRTRPLTETSLIVHWLTPDAGRLATVAKGARQPKSAFRGKLDLFYVAELSFRRSRRSELHSLTEVRLQNTHTELRQDLGLLQQASYCVELIELVTETETPLPAHYKLATEFLDEIASVPSEAKNVLAFELKLLSETGLMPQLESPSLSLGTSKVARVLSEGSWRLIKRLKLTTAQEVELARFLWSQWESQWPRLPRTRGAALGLRDSGGHFLAGA